MRKIYQDPKFQGDREDAFDIRTMRWLTPAPEPVVRDLWMRFATVTDDPAYPGEDRWMVHVYKTRAEAVATEQPGTGRIGYSESYEKTIPRVPETITVPILDDLDTLPDITSLVIEGFHMAIPPIPWPGEVWACVSSIDSATADEAVELLRTYTDSGKALEEFLSVSIQTGPLDNARPVPGIEVTPLIRSGATMVLPEKNPDELPASGTEMRDVAFTVTVRSPSLPDAKTAGIRTVHVIREITSILGEAHLVCAGADSIYESGDPTIYEQEGMIVTARATFRVGPVAFTRSNADASA